MVIQWSLIKPLLYAADNEVEEESGYDEEEDSFDNNYNLDYGQDGDENYDDFGEDEEDFWGSEEFKR